MPFPKIEGYVVTEKLGSGSYSTVYKAYTKVGARTSVAIKCVDKSRVKHSGSAVDNLITEIRLLKTLVHPHIVHMHNFTWDDRNIYIITEYCSGGDLSKYIHRYGRVPETKVLYFLQQLASALKFLREKGVVHMDLKPHNLLLHKGSDGRYILKVADFGFAGHLSLDSPRSVRGSPLYMAPEMLAGRYDDRVDLWSVGVIMYECLFGKAPYSSSTFKELVDKIRKQAPIEIPPNSCITPGCRELLLRLLQHDPDARISYEEFFANEYLDLEHMPSKENYEKAVSLLQLAVRQEARPASALRSYRAGLRLLLPAARAEPDAARRQALTAKLTRYMERAEAIQEYLRAAEGREGLGGQAGLGGQGLGGEGRGGLHDYDDKGPVIEPGPLSGPPQASADNWPSDGGIAESNVEPLPAAPDCPQGGARPKFGLKRFFSKNPPPRLDIDSDPQSDKSGKMGEPQSDACRIT